jgi:microcystin-dependent protein
MASPYIGEIRMFGGNFAPLGWAPCQGQLMAISENDALYNLIGTTYGGDGQQTFALPNLQSRLPVHVGSGYVLGQTGGEESVTLTTSQIAQHNHLVQTSLSGSSNNPAGNVLADEGGTGSSQVSLYSSTASSPQTISPNTVATAGGSQPHDNMVPFVVINFIIALQGIYPSQG